jgi:hypothetical protein
LASVSAVRWTVSLGAVIVEVGHVETFVAPLVNVERHRRPVHEQVVGMARVDWELGADGPSGRRVAGGLSMPLAKLASNAKADERRRQQAERDPRRTDLPTWMTRIPLQRAVTQARLRRDVAP